MSDKPEVNAQRRRKADKPVRQAPAPPRRPSQPTTSSTPSSISSGGYNSGSTGGYSSGGTSGGSLLSSGLSSLLGGTKRKIGCGGIALIIIVIILFFVFSRSCNLGDMLSVAPGAYEDGGYDEEPYQEPIGNEPAISEPSRTPWPTLEPGQQGEQNWLVMVYQDADDQVLEQDIFIDLNEMERMGSVEGVMTVVSQIDRFRGGYAADGDWHSTRRYLVLQDDNLNRIGSELLMDLGEVNMASGDSLVDFVTWAVRTYPADKYMLIMSDHGMGWPGGWSDPNPGVQARGSAPLISQLQGDHIFLSEMDAAFAQIQANTGIDKFDLIGLDACLMSQLEVFSALQPYAHYAVASEETEPGLGWAYSAFLSLIVYNPDLDTAQLAANIVETYIDQDERIVDDQARAEFLRQNSSTGGFFGISRVSADQLASQIEQNITLTAINLDALPDLNASFNAFAYALQSVDQRAVAAARSYTQSFTSIFGRQVPPSYIDLGHFVQMVLKQSGTSGVRQAGNAVLTALDRAIVAERHGRSKPGATGVAIYFPNSTLYKTPATGMQSYTALADRFARVSLWDDFLVYHYSNRPFRADAAEAVQPSVGAITRSPGSGDISIAGIDVSASTVSAGETITLSADIYGDNIGYIYFFTGYYDSASRSIWVADTDYMESPQTEQVNGVYYPNWPDSDSFILNFPWEPTLFIITDGTQEALALFNPAVYGADAEDAIYVVQGTYTFGQTGEQRKAEMLFKDGRLFQVYGYVGEGSASAPAEISTASGDSFTIWNKYMNLDASGNVSEVVFELGDTLVFGSSPFVWEQVWAPEGQYLLGFLVSDRDGNLTQSYVQVRVE